MLERELKVKKLSALLKRISFMQVDILHGECSESDAQLYALREEAAQIGADLALQQLCTKNNIDEKF